MIRVFALFSIYLLVASLISAANGQNAADAIPKYVLNGVAVSYGNPNRKIPIPDIPGAQDGSISGLPNIGQYPISCQSGSVGRNNEQVVDCTIRLFDLTAKYNKYEMMTGSYNRELTFKINQLDYNMKGKISMAQMGQCGFELEQLKVVYNLTSPVEVTGGFGIMNNMISSYKGESVNTIIKFLEQELRSRIESFITRRPFRCAVY